MPIDKPLKFNHIKQHFIYNAKQIKANWIEYKKKIKFKKRNEQLWSLDR